MKDRNKTIKTINEIKTYFLLKPNKIDKLSNTDQEKKEISITNIRNDLEDIIIDPTDIIRIRNKYYEQSHTNKFNNLHEMDKFIN